VDGDADDDQGDAGQVLPGWCLSRTRKPMIVATAGSSASISAKVERFSRAMASWSVM
jgi:hypothetical protein